ncbi:hypothetical protein MtrunA17_Chr4g0029321 [Medicago truncatula]|uniref:Transmembrane protein n=1 Tax=Medicago truncatula TaxID=3880 RepID=A0A396I565_MEDTR|nr:hypothetical protein MtrunA17_Chr4g0029321 [Medicago truncatula]
MRFRIFFFVIILCMFLFSSTFFLFFGISICEIELLLILVELSHCDFTLISDYSVQALFLSAYTEFTFTVFLTQGFTFCTNRVLKMKRTGNSV